MAFQGIDRSALGTGDVYNAALCDDIEANGQEIRTKRLRKGCCQWDVRDLPRLTGSYGYSGDGVQQRTLLPFLWERTSTAVTGIKVRVYHSVITPGDVVLGVVILPWGESALPRVFPANDVSSGTIATTSLASTSLTRSNIPQDWGQDLVIFLTILGTEAGSAASWVDVSSYKWDKMYFTCDMTGASPISTDTIPQYVLTTVEKGTGDDWTTGDIPPPRQLIRTEDAAQDYGVVWPPFANASDGTLNHEFYLDAIASIDLYAIEIEEVTLATLPGPGSALNPGQIDSAQVARGAHLAKIYGCNDCHGENFAGSAGGRQFFGGTAQQAPPSRAVLDDRAKHRAVLCWRLTPLCESRRQLGCAERLSCPGAVGDYVRRTPRQTLRFGRAALRAESLSDRRRRSEHRHRRDLRRPSDEYDHNEFHRRTDVGFGRLRQSLCDAATPARAFEPVTAPFAFVARLLA